MASMYIANCTNQIQMFVYRPLGVPAIPNATSMQEIQVGGQEKLPDNNMTPEEIDYIVEQHARYGMVRVDEIDRSKPFIGLCWDTKPISISKIRTAFEHNQKVLTVRGEKLRQQAAVAVSENIEKQILNTPPDQRPVRGLNAIDLSVIEEEHKDGTDTLLNENINVSRKNPQGPPQTEKTARQAARRH